MGDAARSTGSVASTDATGGRRVSSSDTGSSTLPLASALAREITAEPRRPSAYAHYKKLVRDYDALDEDLEQARIAQDELEAQLQRHKHVVEAHAKAQRDQELAAWVRERERRVEAICAQESAVKEMRKQQDALEEEEIRLQAELAVLHERQQLANESEAKRVFDLVHSRTSLLEKELEKGAMDVQYLTHVISCAKRKKERDGETCGENDAIHAVAGDIRQRRQDALREATAQLQQRLHSFELEREALKRRAEEIQWKKQRALQILSTNQQQVITGFFTTPRAAIQEANPPLPSLEFDAILEALKQPTGDVVSRLRDLEHGKDSGRRQLRDALTEAERNLENGPKRLDAIQRAMEERRQDALRLNITSSSTSNGMETSSARAYDGMWSVETYRPEQIPIVYFVRALVFEWMERALEISRLQPATQLLQLELQRHVVTHAVLETLEMRARVAHCVVEILDEMEQDVVRDMAASILEELRFSADKVRGVVLQQLKTALFFPPTSPQMPNRVLKPSVEQPAPALRWSLFGSAWEEIKYQRELDPSSSRRLPKLLMRPADKAVGATPTASATSSAPSPTKKRFGLFGGASKPSPTEIKPVASTKASEPQPQQTSKSEANHIPPQAALLRTDVPPVGHVGYQSTRLEASEAERTLWDRHVGVTESSFTSIPTCAFVSCVQLSRDGQLLAVGTLDGEVILFTIDGGDVVVPALARVSGPDKAASSSGTIGVARVTRLCFSSCSRMVLSFNQLNVATLWSLALPPTPSASSHSAECFAADTLKAKAISLTMVSVLQPMDLFQEPPTPAIVLEQDAPVAAARLQAMPATTVSAVQFFPTVSLIGEPTHLICGASNGDLLKVALSLLTKKESAKRPEPEWRLGPTDEAAFGLPRPADGEIIHVSSPAPKKALGRESFRSAHRHSVIFVGSIASPTSASVTRIVSVDQRGGVVLWIYSRSNFSGFGWFVPHAVYQLDLGFPGYSTGDILQIQLTPDQKTLVLMVFAAPMATVNPNTKAMTPLAGRLRFVQLDLTTNELRVKPVRMELGMAGTIAPRFGVVRLQAPSKATPRPRSAAARTVPGLTSSGVSFLVLLMDNALHVLSLQTGEPCRPAIALHTTPPKANDSRAKTNRKEPPLVFNSISACSIQNPAGQSTAIVAIAGEQHRHVRFVRFHILSHS